MHAIKNTNSLESYSVAILLHPFNKIFSSSPMIKERLIKTAWYEVVIANVSTNEKSMGDYKILGFEIQTIGLNNQRHAPNMRSAWSPLWFVIFLYGNPNTINISVSLALHHAGYLTP